MAQGSVQSYLRHFEKDGFEIKYNENDSSIPVRIQLQNMEEHPAQYFRSNENIGGTTDRTGVYKAVKSQ